MIFYIDVVRGVLKSIALLGALGIVWAQAFNPDTFVGARGRYWAFQKVLRPAVPGSPVAVPTTAVYAPPCSVA